MLTCSRFTTWLSSPTFFRPPLGLISFVANPSQFRLQGLSRSIQVEQYLPRVTILIFRSSKGPQYVTCSNAVSNHTSVAKAYLSSLVVDSKCCCGFSVVERVGRAEANHVYS